MVPLSAEHCLHADWAMAVLRPGHVQVAQVAAEPHNPEDGCAVVVVDGTPGAPSTVILGHVPAAVARHLSPLLRTGACTARAVVTRTETRATASVPIVLTLCRAQRGRDESAQSWVTAAVQAAAAAAGGETSQPGCHHGEWVRSAFRTLLDTVWEHDAHVLSSTEEEFRWNYEVRGDRAESACCYLCPMLPQLWYSSVMLGGGTAHGCTWRLGWYCTNGWSMCFNSTSLPVIREFWKVPGVRDRLMPVVNVHQ